MVTSRRFGLRGNTAQELPHASSLSSNLSSRMLGLPRQRSDTCQEGDKAKQQDAATRLTGGSSTFATSQLHLQRRRVLGSRFLKASQQVRAALGTRLPVNAVKRSRSRLWPPGQSNQNDNFGSKEKGTLPSNLAT